MRTKYTNDSRFSPFANIPEGECFLDGNELFMKTVETFDLNAVRLSDGLLTWYEPSTVVEPVQADLTVRS